MRAASRQHKKGGGVYVWRTRKPHAVLGLPIIGRHFAYGGKTNSFRRRGKEHIEGSTQYEVEVRAKPWADLDPKVYEIRLPDWGWLRTLMEPLLIAILCPVYNVQLQPPWNIRKISKKKAEAQRWRRDQFGATIKLVSTIGRWTVYAVIAYLAWKIWGPNGWAQ